LNLSSLYGSRISNSGYFSLNVADWLTTSQLFVDCNGSWFPVSMSEAISEALWNLITITGNTLQQVPGLAVVVRYVQRSYQNDPIRVIIEVLVFIWALYYVLKRDETKDNTKLTERVVLFCRSFYSRKLKC
jgi:hypothetical protein